MRLQELLYANGSKVPQEPATSFNTPQNLHNNPKTNFNQFNRNPTMKKMETRTTTRNAEVVHDIHVFITVAHHHQDERKFLVGCATLIISIHWRTINHLHVAFVITNRRHASTVFRLLRDRSKSNSKPLGREGHEERFAPEIWFGRYELHADPIKISGPLFRIPSSNSKRVATLTCWLHEIDWSYGILILERTSCTNLNVRMKRWRIS